MAVREVPTRRVRFDDALEDLPRHFAADGDLVLSHTVAALSSVFPDGEDFFVRSVRHFRDQISDPELMPQVQGFIGQEASHGRTHRALNERLDQLGYPAKRIERFVRFGFRVRERVMTANTNLAATVALEHFTATLAEMILDDPEARRVIGDPVVTELFLWHALEECEHKAVAFDVYRAVGGSERTRVMQMNAITVGFIVGMAIQIGLSLLGDRRTYRRGELWASLARLPDTPFLRPSVWRRLRRYNAPDFHPDERDTSALVECWHTELFGPDGRLRARLAGAA